MVVKNGNGSHFPWQRLALSLLGISILVAIWRWATWHLYSLPEHSISAFASLTNNTVYAIAALVIFFVTGRLVYEWKNQTTSEVVQKAEQYFEKKENREVMEHIETMRTPKAAHFDGEDIA